MRFTLLTFLHVILFLSTSTLAQQIETTTTVIVTPPTITLATTITSYAPDVYTTVTASSSISPQYASPIDMRNSVLNSTNFFRWEHNASFLAWNASLASYAAAYAQECTWAHSHGAPGENLARGYPDVRSAIDAWGDERSLYNFTLPTGFTEETGHFTQLVWKGTQTVGCAALDCRGRNGVQGWLLVCEYWPSGNIIGQGGNVNAWFRANVQSQVNSGAGFDVNAATAGAGGVGTSWASAVPVPTGLVSSANRVRSKNRKVHWEMGILGTLAVIFGLGG